MIPTQARPDRRHRAAAAAALLAGASAGAFVLILATAAFVRFPREVALYTDREGPPATAFRQDFEVKPGGDANLWRLEIELSGDLKPGQEVSVSLNEAPLASFGAEAGTFTLEFPGSRLDGGTNSLRLDSTRPFFCPRFRVLNVTGYDTGLISAVLFPRTNVYPGIPDWPGSAGAWALTALIGIAMAGLDFLSGRSPERARGVFRVLRGARFAIPAALLAVAAVPLVSRYKALLGLPGVLFLAVVYLMLAFAREMLAALVRAGRLVRAAARAAGSSAWQALSRVPFLRTWDRALSAALIALFAVIGLALPGPNEIRGDGIEYYAMSASLARFGTPYITPESAAYTSKLVGRLPWAPDEPLFDWIQRVLNPLVRNGRQLDPAHFWFYSLLGALFFWPLRLLGLGLAAAFVLLHIALAVLAFAVVRRVLGPLAGVCLMLIVFGSPLPWFITRPQVELFTALLAIVAVACFVAERYLGAALAFSVAATQNPPFAVLAGLVFLFGFARRKRGLFGRHVPLWAAAGLLAVVNPAYYYFRYRVLNPIVAAGAAKVSPDVFTFKKMISIFIDPDIGLFPDWPLALVLLVALIVLGFNAKTGLKRRVWAFLGLACLILLWSQSSTQNFNHGGTYHISRYALWYIPVFFLALWRLLAALPADKAALRRRVVGAAVLLCLLQGWHYRPTRPETYLEQTPLSTWLYDHVPALFNPHPEVFVERQLGMEEYPPYGVWAVSNRSGNKILVMRGRLHYDREEALPPVPNDLNLDPVLVYKEALRRAGEDRSIGYFYINGMADRLRRAPQ